MLHAATQAVYAKCDSGAFNLTLPQSSANTYYLPGGEQQFNIMCLDDGAQLPEIQAAGYENGSSFVQHPQPAAAQVLAMAKAVLKMEME
jgi:hypothetical protein